LNVNPQRLLDGLRVRDPEIQKLFWETHFPEIHAICLRISRSAVHATDTAVDLLTDFMFDRVDAVRNPMGIRAYLRLMAVRRSVRQRDQASSHLMFDENHAQGVCADAAMTAADCRLLLPKLDKCLAELTPKAQSVLRLKYTRQLTDREIGNILGGSKQYIGRLLRNSLVLLRDCINERR
jgi:RNA polymerase sigma factor (sigma-70 family)